MDKKSYSIEDAEDDARFWKENGTLNEKAKSCFNREIRHAVEGCILLDYIYSVVHLKAAL